VKTAIALLTKDRCDLTRQSALPLLKGAEENKFDMFWFDGSTTQEGIDLPVELDGNLSCTEIRSNVGGGPGRGIVVALDTMLRHPNEYTHVGLVENDVLLKDDWFERAMIGFTVLDFGVGAVSARCYEDRVLTQIVPDYAIMHDLGAGQIILTREAAEIVLRTFRAGWTTDNRRAFQRLSGIDIGPYWAFGFQENWLTADWHWGAALACHGFAMVALTPSPVEMIGQDPPLEQQRLKIAEGAVTARENNAGFRKFASNLNLVRSGKMDLGIDPLIAHDPTLGNYCIVPHQIGFLGGAYTGEWTMRDARSFGPFVFEAKAVGAEITVNVAGPCNVLLSGGEKGASFEVSDVTGFAVTPELPPEGDSKVVLTCAVPGSISQRQVRIRALTPGGKFYGLQMREPPALTPGFDVVKFMVDFPVG